MMIKSLIGGAAIFASVTFASGEIAPGQLTGKSSMTWLASSLQMPSTSLLSCGTTPTEAKSCNLSWRYFLYH